MASSSSTPSSSLIPAQKHHVFLSFRGEDTRNKFVGHLYRALDQAGVHTFRDKEKLEKGDLISPQLLQAIEESSISIVILSKNYANSSWCMDELGKIIECRDQRKQKVYPVFYKIEPSDVRKQLGNFGKGFDFLCSKFQQEPEKTKKWKLALEEICKGSGFHLSKAENKCEAEFIEEIINEVFKTVGKIDLGDLPGLVGVEARAEKVIKLLDLQSNEVHVVGIWGMGGIGKTTIAEFVYNQISWEFNNSCYLENVKEVLREKGAKALQKHLIENLSRGKDIYFPRSSDGLRMIKNMIYHRKILIVLDDVDHSVKIEKLIGNLEFFGKGSRIIITTRDKHLLAQYDAKHYKVELLNDVEALQLFSLKAFGKNQQIRGFKELVHQAIAYAGGLPLALEVLGSYLRGEEKSVWKSALDRLKQYPEEEVQSILKISYDALQETEQQIFLDIACCLKNEDKETVAKILDSCGFYASSGLSVLENKSLISISYGKIRMHQLIQEMGWNIVRKESKNPAERTRLWDLEDLHGVLIENKETKATESIAVQVNEGETLQLGTKAFSGMTRLRLLYIEMLEGSNVQFGKEFEYLPNTLRYLHFANYPFKHMPSMFQPVHLVELYMRGSNLECLWKQTGNVHLPTLSVMDLSFSRLTECPDFTTTPNLESLNLDFCRNLKDVHPSIGVLRKLIGLSFFYCDKLMSIPETIGNMKCLENLDLGFTNITEVPKSFGHLTSLKRVSLWACLKVTSLPDCFENMKCLENLLLELTNIAELPTSIVHLTALKVLYLLNCKSLRRFPKGLCPLKDLERLNISGCEKLDKLPEDLDDMKSSVNFLVANTAIREVPLLDYVNNDGVVSLANCRQIKPDSLGSSFRRYSFCSPGEKRCDIISLDLTGCHLRWIPVEICLLYSLKFLKLSLNDFECLPASMVQLSKLQSLYLDACDRLQQLPKLSSSLRTLVVDNCKSLRTICNPLAYRRIVEFSFLNCCQLVESNLLRERLILNRFRVSNHLVRNLKGFKCTTPGCEIPKWFSHQNRMGSSISFQLPPDCCNDNLLGFLVCFVFEVTGTSFQGAIEIKGWGKRHLEKFRRFNYEDEISKELGTEEGYRLVANVDKILGGEKFSESNYKHETSNELGTRDNVMLVAIKRDANLIDGGKIKIQPVLLEGVKVKKCGAHVLYKDDPIFSCTFSSVKSKDGGRSKKNKKRPLSGDCNENFSTQQIMLDQHFDDNNMVDEQTSARTHPVGLTDPEHTKFKGGKERNCHDQLDIDLHKDVWDCANFEEEQNTKKHKLSHETLELDIDLNEDAGDHSGSANFEEEQSIKRPRLSHETLDLDLDLKLWKNCP